MKIVPTKNGPFLVERLLELTNSKGNNLEVQPVIALCRCGGSSTKPFCDGTHAKIGFTDGKENDRVPDKKEVFVGKEITINDNRGVCAHAGFCTDNAPKVFRMGKEPWINPDGEPSDKTARVIRMCPSGALSYKTKLDEWFGTDRKPRIFISKDGPYYVQGSIKLESNEQPELEKHYTLCRCGHSKNKPFCNGAHWDSKFSDDQN